MSHTSYICVQYLGHNILVLKQVVSPSRWWKKNWTMTLLICYVNVLDSAELCFISALTEYQLKSISFGHLQKKMILHCWLIDKMINFHLKLQKCDETRSNTMRYKTVLDKSMWTSVRGVASLVALRPWSMLCWSMLCMITAFFLFTMNPCLFVWWPPDVGEYTCSSTNFTFFFLLCSLIPLYDKGPHFLEHHVNVRFRLFEICQHQSPAALIIHILHDKRPIKRAYVAKDKRHQDVILYLQTVLIISFFFSNMYDYSADSDRTVSTFIMY